MKNKAALLPKICVLLAVVTVAGCEVPEDTPGAVTQYNGSSVTIRGVFSDNKIARPTKAMVDQAKGVCPGAKYLSATPTPDSLYTFDYLFSCK